MIQTDARGAVFAIAGRNTEFYEKFNIRQNVGEILEYTWNIPLHKEAWKKVGEEVRPLPVSSPGQCWCFAQACRRLNGFYGHQCTILAGSF